MANYFIAQTARGSGDGSTSTNAAAASFFNTSGNWSGTAGTSGKISPGDTVWICDIVSTPLVFQGSGTPGSPITLTYEPGGRMRAGTWATAAILVEGDLYAGLKHDIVIDGGAGGRIEATASGTGRTYASCGYGVRAVGVSRIEVKNLRVFDLFVRTAGNDNTTPGIAISCVPAVGAAMADVSIHDNIVQHCFIGVNTSYNTAGVSNVAVYRNTIRYINWGIQCGSEAPGATIDGLQIYGNTISNFSNWDEPGTNFHHHNGIFVWTNNSDTTSVCTGLRIHGNTIGSDFGSYATSGIYVSAPGHRSEIWIYNNLFKSFGSNPTNGDIFVVPGPGATTRIYNNTHVGTQGIAIGYGGDHGGAQTVIIRNNIVRGAGGGKVALYISYGNLVTLDCDRNSFSGMATAPTGFSYSSGNSASFRTWSQWQALGYDANSQHEVDPLLDANYRITNGSPALDVGADLSAYFTLDMVGKTRAPHWDLGAFKGILSATSPIYVAETPLGAGNGTTPENARSMSWLNDSANWNAGGPICPSATNNRTRTEIRWVGTITTPFDWPYATGSGEAGIDFVFHTGAKFSKPHWGGGTRGAAIYWESGMYKKDNVTIDFGADGKIEATDNGTLLGNQAGGVGIYIKAASNVTIKRPRIENLYVRTSGWHEAQKATDGRNTTGIFLETNTGGATDFVVENGTIHDCDKGIIANWLSAGCARYVIRGNEIFNVNWGVGGGGYGNGTTMSGYHVYGNWVHDFECWDRPFDATDDPFHHNGVFLYGEPMPSGVQPNMLDAIIEGNHFGPNFGTRATSAVFLSHYNMRGDYDVRNNIFEGSTSNGLITVGIGGGALLRIMNNVFMLNSSTNAAMSIGGSYSGGGFAVISKNNVVTGGQLYSTNYVNGTAYSAGPPERAAQYGFTLESDYNLVTGYADAPVNWSTTNSYGPLSWATWQGMGQDAHGIVDANPLLGSNGRPGAGSPALGAGVNLAAFFTNDYEGATRVAPWDMGPFKGAGAGPALPATNPIRSARFPHRALIRAL